MGLLRVSKEAEVKEVPLGDSVSQGCMRLSGLLDEVEDRNIANGKKPKDKSS